MTKAIVIILLMLVALPSSLAGEIAEPGKMEKEFVNAVIALILELIDVLEAVLETDIDTTLSWQIVQSVIRCKDILNVLTN